MNSKKTHVNIIIITFNSAKHIKKCVDSIESSLDKTKEWKITIIDNNSKDSSKKLINLLKKNYRNISTIFNSGNIGFARAVNIGIRSSQQFDYHLLINPDVVVSELSINNLVNCAIKHNSDITGGDTYGEDGIENGSFFRKPNFYIALFDFTNLRKLSVSDYWHKYFYYSDYKGKTDTFKVDVVTGGFMLISKKAINLVGLFDERFFMYLEDVDYCVRAGIKKLKIIHTRKSRIMHVGGGSSKNKYKIRHSAWLMSRKKYFMKHFGILTNIVLQFVFFVDDALIYILKNLNK